MGTQSGPDCQGRHDVQRPLEDLVEAVIPVVHLMRRVNPLFVHHIAADVLAEKNAPLELVEIPLGHPIFPGKARMHEFLGFPQESLQVGLPAGLAAGVNQLQVQIPHPRYRTF